MSNLENELFIEDLRGRMTDLLPHLTRASIDDFERYIKDNDLEDAEALVEGLEALYADDLVEA